MSENGNLYVLYVQKNSFMQPFHVTTSSCILKIVWCFIKKSTTCTKTNKFKSLKVYSQQNNINSILRKLIFCPDKTLSGQKCKRSPLDRYTVSWNASFYFILLWNLRNCSRAQIDDKSRSLKVEPEPFSTQPDQSRKFWCGQYACVETSTSLFTKKMRKLWWE